MFNHGEYYSDFDTVSLKPIGKLETVSGKSKYVECFFDSNGSINELIIHTLEFGKQQKQFLIKKGDFLYSERIVQEPGDINKYVSYLGYGKKVTYFYGAEKETDPFEFNGVEVCDYANFTDAKYLFSPAGEHNFLPFGSFKDFAAFSPNFGYVDSFISDGKHLKINTRYIVGKQEMVTECYEYSGKSMFWLNFYPEYVFSHVDCDSLK